MKNFFLIVFLAFFLPVYALDNAYDLYNAGEYKKALAAAEQLEREGKADTALYLFKYEIYKKTGKIKEAKAALQNVVRYDPQCFEAYIALAALLIEEGDSTGAKKYFKSAIDINSQIAQTPGILYYYAKICILDKDFASALENILLAIEFQPDENLYYVELGKIYLYKNQILKAVNAFEYAIGADNELNAECYNYIGLANYKRRNYKSALENFERAVQIRPGIIYLNNLALCYKSLNDKTNYEKTVARLNSMKPIKMEEFLEISQTRSGRGDFSGANSILKAGLEKYPGSPVLKEAFKILNKT